MNYMHTVKQCREFFFLICVLLCVSLRSIPALSKAPLQGVCRQAKTCGAMHNTAHTTMAALCLVLLDFRSTIELPVIKIYRPARPAITAIVYYYDHKSVEYLANDNMI